VRPENEKNVQEAFPAKVTSTATGLILACSRTAPICQGSAARRVLDADGHVVGMVIGAGGPPDKTNLFDSLRIR